MSGKNINKRNVEADARTYGNWAKTTGSYFSDPRTLEALWQIFSGEKIPLPYHVCLADLGGASGLLGEYFSKQLREQGHSVDFTLVDLVQAHLDENTNPTTTKVCADLLEYAPSQAHDLVLLRSVMQYFSFEDQACLAENLHACLAPGGYLLSQALMPYQESRELFMKSVDDIGKELYPLGSADELTTLYSSAGFEVKRLEDAPIWHCPSDALRVRYGFSDQKVADFAQKILDTPKENRKGFKAKEDLSAFFLDIPFVVHLCYKE